MSLGTGLISAICQILLVFLWADSCPLEIRYGHVICFGQWNLNGCVLCFFWIEILRVRACFATFPFSCFLEAKRWSLHSPGQGGRTAEHSAPASLPGQVIWAGNEVWFCTASLTCLFVYWYFSYCSSYRFTRKCKSSMQKFLVPFAQFLPMVLLQITITVKFWGYLSIIHSILTDRGFSFFKNIHLNCRDKKLFQTWVIFWLPLFCQIECFGLYSVMYIFILFLPNHRFPKKAHLIDFWIPPNTVLCVVEGTLKCLLVNKWWIAV